MGPFSSQPHYVSWDISLHLLLSSHWDLYHRLPWRPGGATPPPRSGAAGRSHLATEARGGDPEEPPRAQSQGRQLGGATHARGQGQRPGGATRGSVAEQAQEGLEELSHVEGQERRQ